MSSFSAIVVASSTGGPGALTRFFEQLPADVDWPILIVQHIQAAVSASFVNSLALTTRRKIISGNDGHRIARGDVIVAPGRYHMTLERRDGGIFIKLMEGPRINFVCPSADPLFESAAMTFEAPVIGIVLTGLGEDGLSGAKAIVQAGGVILAQDKDSSVIWGMPGAVVNAGLVRHVGAPERLAARCASYWRTAQIKSAGNSTSA